MTEPTTLPSPTSGPAPDRRALLWLAIGGPLAAVLWAYWPNLIEMPFTFEIALSAPLQALATLCSTFLLQTLGLPAVAEGTIIRINDNQIGVVEACSGLRMLIVFFALSTGLVMLVRAPLPDKL